ncbi:MAG TPA: 2-oxoglutarate dehydrogenase, E2 component, dihydrolipoamide succinyltransferase [Candidatus Polarisedimenticolia bacterium]|nr:2-oxoglutarate dehydrogenase, E2 component, dihydrolipoamide succinyltransferase [Candidatus Polarisedimenticolia bacterium]
MRVDVIMPQMGESIAEGTLTRWLKKPGDKVARDEPIFEISTDKVDAEIPSPAAGTLVDIKVQEGQTVPINTVVAQVETEASAAAAVGKAPSSPAPAAKPAPTPAAQPAAAAPSGDGKERGARATASPQTPATAPAGAREVPKAASLLGQGASVEDLRRVRSSPVVRKIAEEHNIDISGIQGTGISGRVTKTDILKVVDGGGARAASPVSAAPALRAAAPAPVFAPGERTTVVPMSPMRKKIAEHMVMSKRTSAHVTTVFEVDMSRVMKLRAEHQQAFLERHGVKLTPTPFMVKAAVEALKAFPEMNASIDGDSVVYKKDINVGIAVALDWGLIVPVVKHADDLSLSGIAKTVTDLAERARAKKLTPDEVQGGTFTITNPGIFGSLFGTPIINQPQVGIMGVGAIQKRVVVVDDAIGIRQMVFLTLSFDHRLIDGAVADQFMAQIRSTLQEGRFTEIV